MLHFYNCTKIAVELFQNSIKIKSLIISRERLSTVGLYMVLPSRENALLSLWCRNENTCSNESLAALQLHSSISLGATNRLDVSDPFIADIFRCSELEDLWYRFFTSALFFFSIG